MPQPRVIIYTASLHMLTNDPIANTSSIPINCIARNAISEQLKCEQRRKREKEPEIAMAKPQPPPETSFHEPIEGGSVTRTGDCNGVLCDEAPGKYPHMYTAFSLSSSIKKGTRRKTSIPERKCGANKGGKERGEVRNAVRRKCPTFWRIELRNKKDVVSLSSEDRSHV